VPSTPKAYVGGSSAEMLAKRAVLLLSSFELAPRTSVFTVLDFVTPELCSARFMLHCEPEVG